MSLNGDIMVMRNGRSTSQVSIYNYPEHLNPFYEDEQHKRLRFWHINKKGRNGEEGRRNSFSMSGLKDMWAFKSFRLGKKRSSTLGINKTSESPPPLRRDYDYNGNGGCNTYDPRMRYSNNTITTNNNEFPRNAGYRSSLQNMHTTRDVSDSNGLNFNRNNQYRSTIQFAGGNRYGGGGGSHSASITPQQPRRFATSLTPQPTRSGANDYGTRDGVLLRGSSQCSVSTNPFETDYEDDDDERENTPFPGELNDSNNSNNINGNSSSSAAAKKRTPRKKRRAPPVPLVHKNNVNESSQQQAETEQLRIIESQEISNLTAEIESFVKTSNDTADNIETSTSVRHSQPSTVNRSNISTTNTTTDTATTTTTTTTAVTVRNAVEQHREESTPTKKANGAIPKAKDNSTIAATTTTTTPTTKITTQDVIQTKELPALKIEEEKVELRIAENELPKPQQRSKTVTVEPVAAATTTTTASNGHLECIHVHIDEDRCETPVERDSPSRVTSFKPQASPRSHETQQAITTKTSFTLVNPPNGAATTTTTTNTLHINEQQQQPQQQQQRQQHEQPMVVERRSKPALAAKPAHIPQINITAEVHKPNRRSRPISGEDGAAKETSNTEITTTTKSVTISEATTIIEPTPTVTVTAPTPSPTTEAPTPNEVTKSTTVKSETVDLEMAPLERLTTKRTTTASVREVSFTPLSSTTAGSASPATTTVTTTTTAATPSLRIVESNDNLHDGRDERDERFYVPKPRSLFEWKHSTLAPLGTNVPPEKRKSVKDIIESINRSQRLLQAAAHKDQPLSDSEMQEARLHGTMTPLMPRKFSEPSNNFDDNRQAPIKSPRKISSNPSMAGAGAGALHHHSDDDGFDDDDDDYYVEDGAQKLNNTEIFKKCRVNKEVYDYRETSPTASNLDWNPLPKPKRTKNMPDI